MCSGCRATCRAPSVLQKQLHGARILLATPHACSFHVAPTAKVDAPPAAPYRLRGELAPEELAPLDFEPDPLEKAAGEATVARYLADKRKLQKSRLWHKKWKAKGVPRPTPNAAQAEQPAQTVQPAQATQPAQASQEPPAPPVAAPTQVGQARELVRQVSQVSVASSGEEQREASIPPPPALPDFAGAAEALAKRFLECPISVPQQRSLKAKHVAANREKNAARSKRAKQTPADVGDPYADSEHAALVALLPTDAKPQSNTVGKHSYTLHAPDGASAFATISVLPEP